MKPKSSIQKSQKAKIEFTKVFLATLLLIFVNQFIMAQTVHTVDNRSDSGAMYTTVQAAIDAAVAGDIIHIHPSATNYETSVFVNKTLTLKGLGHNPANANGVRALIPYIYISGNAPNCRIEGMAFWFSLPSGATDVSGATFINNNITGSISGGSNADDWEIYGNIFSNSTTYDNIVQGNSTNWIIANNIFRRRVNSLDQYSVFVNNIMVLSGTGSPIAFVACDNPTVSNNLFLFPDAATGVGISSSTITYTNCLTYSYATSTIADLSGANNYNNMDPLFESIPTALTDYYNNDYRLATGSPGENGGFDGTDIGLFGRNFVFDVNGRPDQTPYPTSIDITNILVSPGQDLNVLFQASQKQ